jgi:multisubunit Na+/H+ antiporter MnhG subunit
LTEYVIGLLELMEAEGRALRRAVVRTGMGLGLLLVAVGLILTGLGFLMAATYMALAVWLGAPWAAFAVGVAALLLAVLLVWLAQRMTR